MSATSARELRTAMKRPGGRRATGPSLWLFNVHLGACLLTVAAAAGLLFWKEIRARYLLATRFERLGANAQGYQEYRHIETGIVFVRLPGGTFWMGSTEEERMSVLEEMLSPSNPADLGFDLDQAFSEEGPRHSVALSPFLIAKLEVSQAEWTRVMGKNRSQHRGMDHPVETVFWDEVKEFCLRTGLALPTEAQWEYACRAGTDGRFSGTGNIDEMGSTENNAGEATHLPVGGRGPNAFGRHDMEGDVAEWVEDVFDFCFYSRPEATARDPVATVPCEFGSAAVPPRVIRGGMGSFRPAARTWYWEEHASADLGFRPVFNLR